MYPRRGDLQRANVCTHNTSENSIIQHIKLTIPPREGNNGNGEHYSSAREQDVTRPETYIPPRGIRGPYHGDHKKSDRKPT